MQLWEACLLGAVQGLTEFLPVSSSGHLAVAQHFLPARGSDPVAVEVALHLGTLAAVLLYFAADLVALARGVVWPRRGPRYARRWVTMLALATVPAGLFYVVFGPRIEAAFNSLKVIGGNFLITGTFLALAARARPGRKGEAQMSTADALVVGSFQGVALLPGISRSGATIGAGLVCGLRGEVAANFSFLLSIPAIVGAQMVKLPALANESAAELQALLAGTVVAAVVGWVAIDGLLRLVRRGKLLYFAPYCWAVGAMTLGVALAGW
jgi:undecaprenyl-diphosphatase